MNAYLLEPSELKVECELRNIKGLQSVQQSMLKLSLSQELSGTEEAPREAHVNGSKNPKREVELCAKKIVEIHEQLKEELKSNSQLKPLVLEVMKTRVQHYLNRLHRISSSPIIADLIHPVLELCQNLMDRLGEIVIDNEENLNESIQKLDSLDTALAKVTIETIAESEKSSNLTPTENIASGSGVCPGSQSHVETNLAVSKNGNIPVVSEPNTLTPIPKTSTATAGVVIPPSADNILQFQKWTNELFPNLIPGNPLFRFPCPNSASLSNMPQPSVVFNQGQPPQSAEHGQPPQQIAFANNSQNPGNAVLNTSVYPRQIPQLSNLFPPNNPHALQQNNNQPPPANVRVVPSGPTSSSPNLNPHNTHYLNDFANANRYSSHQSHKFPMIHKWNLSFDGSRDGLNVERFLYRVESNASSYNIPEYQLLNEIQHLLKGKALNWYWAFKESEVPRSWFDLKNAMIKQFRDSRNDFDVRQAIGARKQKPNESFQDFHSAISELTLALSEPLRDFDLMLILHGNMRLGLKEKLAGKTFRSSSELFDECVHIEATWRQISFIPENHMNIPHVRSSTNPENSHRSGYQQQQYSRNINEMDCKKEAATTCYYENSAQPEHVLQSPDVSAFSSQNPVSSRNNNLQFPKQLYDKVKCWNCGNYGHFYYQCNRDLQHIFCRGCGQGNVTFEYCAKCQENLRRGARTGTPTSQISYSVPKPSTEEVASNTDPEFYRILKAKKPE